MFKNNLNNLKYCNSRKIEYFDICTCLTSQDKWNTLPPVPLLLYKEKSTTLPPAPLSLYTENQKWKSNVSENGLRLQVRKTTYLTRMKIEIGLPKSSYKLFLKVFILQRPK